MIIFPNAKINLGLNILNKRPDGFHNLETVFYPVPLCDILEIIEKPSDSGLPFFNSTGLAIDSPIEKNLCVKAYYLLKNDFDLPEVAMHLHKNIPLGAGLGGGSADAAFTVILLNKLFSLNLDNEKMIAYAKKLGSDCSFFIMNKPAFAQGRGEILQPIDLNLSDFYIMLIKPQVHISTAEAYNGVIPKIPKKSLSKNINLPIESWKGLIENDFEKHIFEKYAPLKEIKETLYQSGAVYAAMSGSGSTIYGIFKNKPTIETEFKNCFTWIGDVNKEKLFVLFK